MIVLCNFVPVERKSYCFGVPYKGRYTEVFNSASPDGAPMTNGTVKSQDVPMHNFSQSVCIDIPPFACLYFEVKKDEEKPDSVKKADEEKKSADNKKSAADKKAETAEE